MEPQSLFIDEYFIKIKNLTSSLLFRAITLFTFHRFEHPVLSQPLQTLPSLNELSKIVFTYFHIQGQT